MDKEGVVNIYTMEYYSDVFIKKELIYVIFRDVDGPGDCHTKWSKSEKQISLINISVWNLEKW